MNFINYAIYSVILLLFATTSFSQITVDYNQTFNMNIEGPKNEGMMKMIEHFKVPVPFTLKISNNVGLYEEVEKLNNDQADSEIYTVGGAKISKIYTDYNEGKQIEELAIESKKYLVTDSIMKYDWKILSKENDTINGYSVRYATLQLDEKVFVEAWYSTDLPFKFGPNLFGGLPGLILRMRTSYKDQPGSYQLIEAVKIEEDKSIKIKSPNKGEIISRHKFQLLMEEYTKKVREMMIQDCAGDCDL